MLGLGGGGGGVPQAIVAVHPAPITDPSDINLMVIHPEVATIIPGEFAPLYDPKTGEAVVGPL
jgi:hypothetical protein